MSLPNNLFAWLFEGLSPADTPRDKGMRLYELGSYKQALHFLQAPDAELDDEALFVLGSIIERDPSAMLVSIEALEHSIKQTEQADLKGPESELFIAQANSQILELQNAFKAQYMTHYQAAAEQGNIDAMLRLGGAVWNERAALQLDSGVLNDDPEALLNMYALTKNTHWLKRSAETGNAVALYLIAEFYDNSPAPSDTPVDMHEHITDSLKASALGGYPPAMFWYANRIEHRANFDLIQLWRVKEAQAGSVNAVARYAMALCGFNGDAEHNDLDSGFAADELKGFGLLWLISQIEGREHDPYDVQGIVQRLSKNLTLEQIETAKALAHDWNSEFPLVSEFRMRACLV